MNSKAVRDWAFVFIVLAIAVYIIYFLHSKSAECLAKPLPYGVKALKDGINTASEISCVCSVTTLNSFHKLLVNESGIYDDKYAYLNLTENIFEK